MKINFATALLLTGMSSVHAHHSIVDSAAEHSGPFTLAVVGVIAIAATTLYCIKQKIS